MSKYEIRIAKRKALFELTHRECDVIIEKASSKDSFKTKPGLFEHEGKPSVYIPKEKIIVPIEDITRIAINVPVTRWTPLGLLFVKVMWLD